jgi:hypothetical protein
MKLKYRRIVQHPCGFHAHHDPLNCDGGKLVVYGEIVETIWCCDKLENAQKDGIPFTISEVGVDGAYSSRKTDYEGGIPETWDYGLVLKIDESDSFNKKTVYHKLRFCPFCGERVDVEMVQDLIEEGEMVTVTKTREVPIDPPPTKTVEYQSNEPKWTRRSTR